MPSPSILEAVYITLFQYGHQQQQQPQLWELSLAKGSDWSCHSSGSGSSFTSPALFDLVLALRSLNNSWRCRFDFDVCFNTAALQKGGNANLKLLQFSNFYTGSGGLRVSNSFTVSLQFGTPPPSKLVAAERAASTLSTFMGDQWATNKQQVEDALALKGIYVCQMNQLVFDYETIAAPSPANLSIDPNVSPLARLSDSVQGQQLLENLKTLEGLRMFTHMKYGVAVKTTSRHEFIFTGSTLRRHEELFLDLGQTQSGQCWAVITFEGDTSCD